MPSPRPELVVTGDVVLAAGRDGLETAEAIGISDGRVVVAGDRETVRGAALPTARFVDASGSAVIPGLHDAHMHLADLARARRAVDLTTAATFTELLDRLAARITDTPPGAWVVGRGWSADSLDLRHLDRLEATADGRPAFLQSRDGHSAWASSAVLRSAGVTAATDDPPGGRIERRDGTPSGVLREAAVELVRPHVERLRGDAFAEALAETVAELARFGITGVTDAGDFTAASGAGRYAALGDSLSSLADAASVLVGRLRVESNVPAAALEAAVADRLRSGTRIGRGEWIEVGWLKIFADGALGSRTAALFEPYSCESGGDGRGMLTTPRPELERLVAAARAAGIGVAVHAIGDRANALATDVLSAEAAPGPYRDRIEHVQLIRPSDQRRLGASRIVASMQPAHCPSDRDAIERCWSGREAHAYPWRSLRDAGATLAFGSDAPVEPVNPWLGIHSAVRRRGPGEAGPWHGEQALSFSDALAAYTLGPAVAAGRADQGHLRPGAVADLAVLDRPLAALAAAEDDLELTRAQLTLVMGEKVD